jgi:GH35 family endo-1,4-beta-xylanase
MKKPLDRMMYFIIGFFFVSAGTLKAQSSVVSWNFESDSLGYSFAHMGWSQSDVQAVVAQDPLNSSNKVLRNTIHNYNAAPVLQYILPAGKTLADFNSFVFKGYFAQGDVGYKDIMVEAYQTLPTGPFNNNAAAKIGHWNRAQMGSTNWENITVDVTNTSSLKDTIYIAFGIHCAGTGDVGAVGDTTIWYADSVTLVPKPAANPSAVFASSKTSIDFGSDTVGIAKQDSVEIYNHGTDTLKVAPISSTNALFAFSPSAFSIAPSDSSKLTITFTPVDTSSQSGFILLAHNAVGSPDSVSVKGKGIGQSLPIVTNGGFESSDTGVVNNNVKGWLISVGSGVTPPPLIKIVNDTVEEGNRALKVTVNAATSTQWDIQTVADSLRVKPNGQYNYSIWAKAATAGAQVNFTVGYYSTGEIQAIRPATLSTQWQKFSMQFTVTSNETYIRGPVHFSYAVNVGNTIYVDNLQIAEVIQNPVDSSKIWKGPALATGQSKFLGNVPVEPPENTFTKYWNQLTPGNAGKWGSIAGSSDTSQWNWNGLDAQYNFAKTNHLLFKDHNLIWGQQQPAWISSLDSATQYSYIDTWIRMVGQRYPHIDMIDVVNEPLTGHNPPDGLSGRANYIKALGGTGATGFDWIITAFKLARKYLPNTKLLINDFNIIFDNAATYRYLMIIDTLQSRGLIDGIGLQCHSGEMQGTDTSVFIYNLDRLGANGLPVYISELDLGSLNSNAPADDNYQLQQYQRVFPVLWRHPSVKGITLWGYVQGQMWNQTPTSYLINSDGTVRPAFTWLVQFLKDNPMGVKTSKTELPTQFQLAQNFPNPFNPTSEIQYSVPRSGHLTLKVYNILGKEVMTLFDGVRQPGNYAATFNGTGLASGVYFYRLQAGYFTETKKLLLVK